MSAMSAVKRIQALNALRIVMALEIVIYHCGWMFDYPCASVMDFFYGNVAYCCVGIFFFLSGLMMTIAYRQKIANGELGFLSFIGKRLLKQYPIYLCSNLFMLVMLIYRYGRDYFTPGRFLRCITLTSTGWWNTKELPYNDPTWFVCVLVLMYICFYALLRISTLTRIPYAIFALIVVLLGLAAFILDRHWPFFTFHNALGMTGFFSGSLASLIAEKLPERKESELLRILNSRPLRFLGKLSMTVYYMQFPLYMLLGGTIRRFPQAAALFAYPAAVLAAALLVYPLQQRVNKLLT